MCQVSLVLMIVIAIIQVLVLEKAMDSATDRKEREAIERAMKTVENE